MKRALAIVTAILVSLGWLSIPIGGVTAALGLWQPAELIAPRLQGIDLPEVGGVDLDEIVQALLNLEATAVPTPVQVGETNGEPDVTVEPTPEPPTPTPTETPTPLPPTPTMTPTLEPTPEPEPELLVTRVFTEETGVITVTNGITGSVIITGTDGITESVGITETVPVTPVTGIAATATAIAAQILQPPATPTPAPLTAATATVVDISNVRAGPGAEFDVVGTVDAGATVSMIGQSEDGDWYLLSDGSWIAAELLSEQPNMVVVDEESSVALVPTATPTATPTAPPIQLTQVVTTVIADANLRAGPGTNFARLGGVTPGEAITITGRLADGTWYLLQPGSWLFAELVAGEVNVPEVDENGVVIATGVSLIPTPEPGSTPAQPPTVNVVQANLRAGPGVEFAIVGTAAQGDVLVLTGRNQVGDWVRLADDSWIFAVLVDNVPANLPVVQPTPRATADDEAGDGSADEASAEPATIAGANLRSGPGTNFPIVGALQTATPVNPVGQDESGEWLLLSDDTWIFAGLVSNVPGDLPTVETPTAPEPSASEETETEADPAEAEEDEDA